VNQPSLPKNHQPNKLNLQEPRKNQDETCSIPNMVNGETKVNCNLHTFTYSHIYSPSIDLNGYGISHIIYINKYSHIIYIKVCKAFVII
jgi:hypothetical protein